MSHQPDVLVVGGGVIGSACAWFLSREGLSVTLLEREDLASCASGAAAGMLLPFGEADGEGAFLHWATQSLGLFPELCRELRERSGIDPELERCGALHLAVSEDEEQALRAKASAFAAHGLEWLGATELRALEPTLGPELHGGVLSPTESHVRSALLTRAFAGSAADLGARVERGVTATGLERAGSKVTGVVTQLGVRNAGCVVLCAGAWSPSLAPFRLPVEPVKGQILALDAPIPTFQRMLVSPEVYLVPKRDGSVVAGATLERTGFDCRVTAAGMAGLLGAATKLSPGLAEASFRHGWAGLRPATPDGLPAIGLAPGLSGLVVAAGHFRNGVLLAPVTGRLVAELVLGKAPTGQASVFAPDRFSSA